MVNVLDWVIIGSKFEHQSCYYVPFWSNILGKAMNLLITSSNELNSTTTQLQQEWF